MKLYKMRKIIAIYSIVIGILQLVFVLDTILFVKPYSSVGLKGWLSLGIYSLILIIASLLLFKRNNKSVLLLWIYTYGVIIERILNYLLYKEYVGLLEIFIPLVLVLPIFFYSHNKRIVKGLKLTITKNSVIVVLITNLLIILLPQLFL